MGANEVGQLVQSAGMVLAAVGVFLAYGQLRQTKKQAVTNFEDSLTRQYREIIHRIPSDVLLGLGPAPDLAMRHLNDIYNYIDLTNEQVFLRQNGRVRRGTWENWRDGIRSNLSRPAFAHAWEYIKEHASDSFAELRRLEESGFVEDPRKWMG